MFKYRVYVTGGSWNDFHIFDNIEQVIRYIRIKTATVLKIKVLYV